MSLKTLKALERAVIDAAMEVYGEIRRDYPATHLIVVEDLLGHYRLNAKSVQQIRACNALYAAQSQAGGKRRGK